MMTTPYLPEAHERVQRDLIESEREQRRTAEQLARELVKVLQELAILLDGARLESLRRLDPRCPGYWAPEDWRQFFAKIPALTSVSGWGQAEEPRVSELERTIAELQRRLADTEALMNTPAAQSLRRLSLGAAPEIVGPGAVRSDAASFEIPQGMTPPLGSLLAQGQQVWDRLPPTCPAAFRSILSGKGRAGEDLKKAYRRYWLSLYLIGTFGLNATLEIDDLLAKNGGLSSRAGSLSRITDELIGSQILSSEVLRLGSPHTSLRLVRLSPEGRRLFQILFDREPLETDWEGLLRQRHTEQSSEQALAMLILAMHARKRGWATRILPPAETSQAWPELLVLKGTERWYASVELGERRSSAGRSALIQLNEGKVALCASTPAARIYRAAAWRKQGVGGVATDLETLIRARYGSITDQTPLWIESW